MQKVKTLGTYDYSEIKRNGALTHATTLDDLENSVVKEASHERTNTMRVHVHEMSRTGTSMEKERRLVVSWGWGNRRY